MASPDAEPGNVEPKILMQRSEVLSTDFSDTILDDLDLEAVKTDAVAEWKPQRQEYLIMLVLSVISLVVALDATILITVLPTLATDLHGSANDAFWAGTAFLLSNAVFQPFIAALSDIFGRRELLLPSLTLFAAGSILCALSQNFTHLLAGRCVQGVGAGGVISLTQVIFADIVPLRQRPKYFALVLAAWALGTVIGPLIGAIFVEKSTWRWIFWINLPFCAFGLVTVPFIVNLTTERESLKSKLLRVDWIGGFLFISSLASFLIGLSWAGVQFPWSSWRTIVPLVIGSVGLLVALTYENYLAPEPFLRRSLLHNFSAVAAYICALLLGLVLFTGLYYMPFYFSAVRGFAPIRSGVSMFPATCFILPGSAIVSALITRLGTFRIFVWSGFAIGTVGSGLLLLPDFDTVMAAWVAGLSVFGLGTGMVLSSVNFATQAIVHAEDAGRGAAMYAFMRSLGMTLGVALGGSVFQNAMAHRLRDLGLPQNIARNAEAYVAVLQQLPRDDPQRPATVLAYVAGFHAVWETMIGVTALGLLLSLCIKHHSMDKLLLSKHRVEAAQA